MKKIQIDTLFKAQNPKNNTLFKQKTISLPKYFRLNTKHRICFI